MISAFPAGPACRRAPSPARAPRPAADHDDPRHGRDARGGRVQASRDRFSRLRARRKDWRVAATRYEKHAASFVGGLCLAVTFDWPKI